MFGWPTTKPGASPTSLSKSTIIKKEEHIVPSTIGQYYTGIVAGLSWLTMGTLLGYTSPAVPSLKEDKTIDIPEAKLIWVASIFLLGALLGSIVGGLMVHRIGYKLSLMIIIAPLLSIGYIVVGVSFGYIQILIGRSISGLGAGLAASTQPIYLSEIANPEIRGLIGALPQVMITIGILLVNVLGLLVNWWITALVCSVIPIIMIMMIIPCPESPTWLISKSKDVAALKALNFYRGKKNNHDKEIAEIKAYVAESQANVGTYQELFVSWTKFPLMVVLGLMFFQQAGGINSIIFYTVTVFSLAEDNKTLPPVGAVLVCAVQVFATIIGSFLIDRFGRKPLLLLSCATASLSMAGLALFFFLKDTFIKLSMGFLSVIFAILFVSAYSLGFGPIPWLMAGELFPTNLKNKANSLTSCMYWLMAFIVSLTFEPLVARINLEGTFMVFALFNLGAFFFCFFLILETKNKTLKEIEEMHRTRYIGTYNTMR